MEGSLSLYVAAFRSRSEAAAGAGMEVIDEPGAVGVLGVAGSEPHARVLVTDDALAPSLAGWIASGRLCGVSLLEPSPRCRELMAGTEGFYPPETVTAMTHPALQDLPRPQLPAGLSLRSIDETSAGPSLEAAAAMVLMADPSAPEGMELSAFVSYLRRVPAGVRYLAALDETGAVRGTAACAVMGDSAGVFFVATHPNWRGRGVGTAMTNAALAAAREDGATVAALDASSTAGAAIYRRLGFQSAGTLTVLTRAIG